MTHQEKEQLALKWLQLMESRQASAMSDLKMFATLKLQSCLYEYKNVLNELYFHQVAGESDRQRKLRERARRLIADARASTTSTTESVSADADLTSAVTASVRNRSRSPRARDESPTGALPWMYIRENITLYVCLRFPCLFVFSSSCIISFNVVVVYVVSLCLPLLLQTSLV